MCDTEVIYLGRPREKPDKIEHPVLKRLEAVRERMGLSREQFAVRYVGVSYITYHRWCKGGFDRTSVGRLAELEELADWLETKLEEPDYIHCEFTGEIAEVAEGSDQPNSAGPCPICGSEECSWEWWSADQVREEWGLSEDEYPEAPLIRISNRGKWSGKNRGILLKGQFGEEAERLRKEAEDEDAD